MDDRLAQLILLLFKLRASLNLSTDYALKSGIAF